MLADLQIYIACLVPHGLGWHVGPIESGSVSCIMCMAKNDLISLISPPFRMYGGENGPDSQR